MKVYSKNKGFTLVEVLLAIILVGGVLVLMIDVFVVSSRGGPKGSNQSVAVSLAQAKMEEIKNLNDSGISLIEGSGSNPSGSFLPALSNVSVDVYPTNFYLTESDYYQASDGTPGSFSTMDPPRRVDRITQIEWIDDPDGGTAQDYFKVTVTVFWQEENKTSSFSLVKYVYQ